MKPRTRTQQYADIADAVKCINKGVKVKRSTYKDGSIPTKPVVSVDPKSEKIVLKDCLEWLRKHRVMCNRNNVGTGQMGTSGIYSYGIKNGGDIIGLTKQGVHFELETKHGRGGQLSPGQQKRMKDIHKNNGIYLIIHGQQELEYYNDTYHYFS